MPFDALRLVVGGLLHVFGLQWLRKAILRASGYVALHDQSAIYAAQRADAHQATRAGQDWYALTVAFKGVFLEGLEVAFIVVTFGAARAGGIVLAAVAALAALIVVGVAGVARGIRPRRLPRRFSDGSSARRAPRLH